jgi:hypothetical protein
MATFGRDCMQRLIGTAVICSSLLGVTRSAAASPISITIDTSTIAGTAAQLALDFVDGGSPSNSVTVSDFVTDGTLGAPSTSGGVSGSLPGTVTLDDTSFFNELLTPIVLGSAISFTFDTTANGGVVPDEFSVFLLNDAGTQTLFPTTDPSGADALLTFDITGTPGALSLFAGVNGEATVRAVEPVSEVPEPATLTLSALGIGLVRIARRRNSPR